MYDFAPIHKAKQELEANGWAPSKADESRVQNVQVVQNVKIAAAHDALTTACLTSVGLMLD